ncbi:class E sortase [Rothia sp. P7181]|uniref:class E sortase n=1 Tax=Rothia sp. P7181 TaxID=3402663 RepID=UPI003ADF4666
MVIQIIGEILITLGLILLLFVGWQLWWTNISASQTQSQAVHTLAEEFKQAAESEKTSPQQPTSPQQSPNTPQQAQEPYSNEPIAPQNTATPEENNNQHSPEENNPEPPIPHNTDPNNPPVGREPEYGKAYGIVYIPRFGAHYQRPIAEGTGTDVLDTLGLGHYENTAMPGEIGNFALAGHRQTNGAVLDYIDQLRIGDKIYVQTINGYYTYTIYETSIVYPEDIYVIAPNPQHPDNEPTERIMTLTTCHPRFGDTQRYIVHARYEHWQALSAGAPQELQTAQ